MSNLKSIRKDRLVELVEILTDMCLKYSEADTVEIDLLLHDVTTGERKAMGFDVEEGESDV